MINSKKTSTRVLALFAALCMFMTMFMNMPAEANAAATESVSVTYVDKAGNPQTLATWAYDSANTTYKDGANELSIVKDFTKAANQTGMVNGNNYNFTDVGALPYTGINRKPDPRCLSVTTKGILLEDLYNYAETKAGLDLRGNTKMDLSGVEFTYDQYWGLSRYYYPDWYTAASYSATDMGTTERAVPTTLAINGYHSALFSDGTTTPAALIAKADSLNSLRISSGQQKGGNTTIEGSTETDLNEGALSIKNISQIKFTPVYNEIAVNDGVQSGVEGTDIAYKANNATITADDNYFKAAKGEEVNLNVAADTGYTLKDVKIKDTDGTAVETVKDGDKYTFTMPKKAVSVTVKTKNDTAWAGGADFSWYDENNKQDEYHITTPEQWTALAWICSEDLAKINDSIKDIKGTVPTKQFTFEGVQIYLDNDIDMGGEKDGDGAWSGPNYYPVGSQGVNDAGTGVFYGLFCGSFDGQGHYIKNIYCNRGNGQSYQSVGLFGRVGAADGTTYPETDITIKNVAVTGYIHAGRSVGGIVGKTLHVASGYKVTIKNCANYADISSTDSKGVGGISGAAWNGAAIKDCYNAGSVTSGYARACAGGIAGDNEGTITNCYNIGDIQSTASNPFIGGIIGNNDSAEKDIDNCYYLEDCVKTASTGAVTNRGTSKTATEMKAEAFVTDLGSAFKADAESKLNSGYPVLRWMVSDAADIDTSWYNTTDKSFTVWTKAQLKGLAAIVNGTADGISQDDFAGKTVTLGDSIKLDTSNTKYEAKTGTFGASGYPMTAEYYTVNADANIWTPIGTGTATGNTPSTTNYFAGTFDGDGNTVSGLYTDGTAAVQGLFGCVSGTVENLKVKGCVTAKMVAGGIAAYVNGGTIKNCTNNAIVYADGGQVAGSGQENGVKRAGAVGGIVGTAGDASSITNCKNTAAVTCTNTSKGGRASGIIGLIDGSTFAVTVDKNVNSGNIDAYQYSGGIVGMNASTKTTINDSANSGQVKVHSTGSAYGGGIVATTQSGIYNCYNTGNVYCEFNGPTGKAAHFGGIVSDCSQPIENCYNTGKVEMAGTATSVSSDGMICGSGYGTAAATKVKNCYFLDTANTANAEDVTALGALLPAKTDTEMKSADFLTAVNGDGRAYVADSKNINSGYPIVRAQIKDTSTFKNVGCTVTKTDYFAGDKFDDSGMTFWRQYSDNTKEKIDAISPYTLNPTKDTELQTTDTKVTVSFDYNGAPTTADIKIKVYSKQAEEQKLDDALIDTIDKGDYSDEEQAELAGVMSLYEKKIAKASAEEMGALITEANQKFDAAKANIVLQRSKTAAKSEVNKLFAKISDYRMAQQLEVMSILFNANVNIDNADKTVDVDKAIADAKTEIVKIKTDVQMTAEELAEAKTDAKSFLDSYKDAKDYRTAEQAKLAQAIADGKTAIDAATVIEDVADAEEAAMAEIDKIKTDKQLTDEEIAAAKKLTVKSVKATAGKKKITTTWAKNTSATGYQVSVATKKAKTSVAKTIAGNAIVKYVKKSLKKGKTYYVKVRTYKTIKGSKVYGAWSSVKAAKVK